MAGTARATVYLDSRVYRAAKVKAAASDRSISDVVNQALLGALREDEGDLAAFDARAKEPARPFEDALKLLKRDGLLSRSSSSGARRRNCVVSDYERIPG